MAFVFAAPLSHAKHATQQEAALHINALPHGSCVISTNPQKRSRQAIRKFQGFHTTDEFFCENASPLYKAKQRLRQLENTLVTKMIATEKETSPDSNAVSVIPSIKKTGKPRVIVLGTGWGGHAVVKGLNASTQEIVCVSPRNYFLFTPMLPATSVGTVDFRSIIDPIKTAKPAAIYYEATVTDIDFKNKKVFCKNMGKADRREHDFEVEYDRLVISVGAKSSTFGVPGVEENCFFLKEIAGAVDIRKRVIDCFEEANFPDTSEEERKRLLTFVVVGGGPTGVEFAAEMNDFLSNDLKRNFSSVAHLARILLFQSGGEILPAFDQTLRDFAIERFEQRGIEVRTNCPVKEVTSKEITLADGTKIPHGLVVWAAGIGPQPLINRLTQRICDEQDVCELQPQRGRLVVDPYLRVKGADGVYAIGDCAVVEGGPLPMTAQVAAQQGEYLAKALNRISRADDPEKVELKAFKFFNLGIMAYIGDSRAIIEAAPLGDVKLKGFFTWLLWRSVYVTKQVSLRCRVLVLFDFFKTFVFGRDISRF